MQHHYTCVPLDIAVASGIKFLYESVGSIAASRWYNIIRTLYCSVICALCGNALQHNGTHSIILNCRNVYDIDSAGPNIARW